MTDTHRLTQAPPPETLHLQLHTDCCRIHSVTAPDSHPCDPQELLQLDEERMVEFITFAPGLLSRRPGTNSWKARTVFRA